MTNALQLINVQAVSTLINMYLFLCFSSLPPKVVNEFLTAIFDKKKEKKQKPSLLRAKIPIETLTAGPKSKSKRTQIVAGGAGIDADRWLGKNKKGVPHIN